MSTIQIIRLARAWLLAATVVGITSGCVDEAKLNTDSAQYTPEERPLGLVAGEGGEFEPGSTVTVQGRLVGTVANGENIIWEQTAGVPVEVDDWTASPLTFTAPQVEGIQNLTFTITALDTDGNVLMREVEDEDGNVTTEPMREEVTITIFDPASLITYEVEDSSVATLVSVNLTSEGEDQFISGAVGSHTRDFVPGASATFTLDTTTLEGLSEGFYTLYVRYAIPASGYGEKGTVVTVNGVPNEFMVPATGSWDNYRVNVISLDAGPNTIEIGGGWNYYRVDSISLIPAAAPAGPLAVAATLVNEEPIDEAVSLMEYLTQNYGSYTLSGQTEFMNYNGGPTGLVEFDKIVTATGGDAPAIVAFDLMDYSSSRVACGADPGTLSEDMIAAHNERNVILSALWHWNAPMHLVDDTCSSDTSGEAWWHGFYSTATTFDLAAALADTGSAEYQALIDDIDTIAAELQKFEDAGIPILWRPLHEAEGAWFWWGNAGADALKSLWILMFERLTGTGEGEHDLDNLIWVFTHASDLSEDWYPGDNYVDIVGYDGYDGNNRENPFGSQYSTLKNRFNGKKLVALTETGTIPNVETMHGTNAWWSFFITWNSGGDYGPDGAEAADISASYAYEGVLNLDDVPGGRTRYEAGTYADFEVSTRPWGAQINWADTSGIKTSENWATSGLRALALRKDLSAETDPTSVVFQAYPADGFDVSNVSTVTVSAHAVAGPNTTAKLFVKHGDDWVWVDGGAVTVGNEGVELQVDVSGYDWLAGIGVQFENIDGSLTEADFYLDNVRLDSNTVFDFEPDVSGWEHQINWSAAPGITTSGDWATSGARSLAVIKDLSAETGPTDVIFQVYPADGIDVTDASTLRVSGHAVNAGTGTTIKLFAKHGDNWEWIDGGAVSVNGSGLELELDVSAYTWLAGLGFQINGFDASATTARFYLDNVRLDDTVIYDFEGADGWDFQVNWTNTSGIHRSTEWTGDGEFSLAGTTQLADGDDDVILQTYPAGGILLGDVSTLNVVANATDAGASVQVMLWAKDKDGTWRDGGAVDLVEGGTALSLDISDLGELQGFGVRFMGPDNSVSESTYYIDQVEFE